MNEIDYNVMGIDLGTTNSCVSVWKNGQISIVPNEVGKMITPSVVSFLNTETLIGNAAQKRISSNYQNTIFDCKRLIGRKISDETIQDDLKAWPFVVFADAEDNCVFHVDKSVGEKKDFTPEEISGMLLEYLKRQAENFVGHAMTDVVITVPAYFSDVQRQSTENAARLAGLNVLRLLDEPSAAALTYNFANHEDTKYILIFDLGGGTLDVSILEVGNQKVSVVASDGDSHLGGSDFDRNLMDYLMWQFERQTGEDIRNNRLWKARMRTAAENCKIELSISSSSIVEFENSDFSFSVSRMLFENINTKLFTKIMETVQNVLDKAQFQKETISDVVLVGGSTRIPRIQQLLQDFFTQSNLCREVNPDEAVSMGAAIMGAVIQSQQLKVLPQTAVLSFGIESQGGIVEMMIPRGTALPVACSYEFLTPMVHQTAIVFKVVMGERRLVRDCVELGEIVMDDLVIHLNSPSLFTIVMYLDNDYNLSIEVIESTGDKRVVWEMNLGMSNPLSPLLLSEEEIAARVRESEEKREEDEEMVKRQQEMNLLVCLVEDAYAVLLRNDEGMTEEWIQQKRELLQSIEEWIQHNPHAEVFETQQRQQLLSKSFLQSTVPGQ